MAEKITFPPKSGGRIDISNYRVVSLLKREKTAQFYSYHISYYDEGFVKARGK